MNTCKQKRMDVKSLKYFDIFSNSVDSNQEEIIYD